MSRNKYRKTMQQTPNDQSVTEQPAQATEQAPEVQETTAEEVEVVQQEAIPEQPVEVPVQPVINVGAVVQNTSSKLGSKLAESKVKEVLAQSSKSVESQPASQFEKKINDFLAKADSNQKMMVDVLRRYVTEMAPGLMFEEHAQLLRAQKNQVQLFNIIRTTLKEDSTFSDNWRIIIMFFRNYKDGALGNQYPFRFLENITLINAEERQAFMNIINLLIISAGLADKKQVSKYTNLDKTIHRIFGDEVRQRVINYYS